MSKKIEPTVAMILEAASTGTPLGTDARAILRAALNHPDARGLFTDEDAIRAAREQALDEGWNEGWNGAANALGRIGFRHLTPTIRDANPYRPAPALPTEDGAVIVPADGHEYIEAACFGIVWRASEAVLGRDGRWHGVWRRGAGVAAVGSVSPGRITPGIWKVDDQ